MIKLIIFDWDDVFTLGSTDGYKKCYHQAMNDVGIQLDPEEKERRINDKWGSGHIVQLEDLTREKSELLPQAIKVYENHFFGDTFVNCLEIIPGSAEMLARLSKKYKLALATGMHPKLLRERVMPKFNINPNWFVQIISTYDLKDPSHAKPHAYSGLKIMETQKVSPSETIMVGDARNDVMMAKNAGIEPIVVLTGHLNRQQAEDLGVKYTIDDVTKLEDLLSKL